MIIPYTEIPPDTLQALVEEFISREGTDYGEHAVPMTSKVQQILNQLQNKEVFIVYSELHETCTLVTKDMFSDD